MLPVGVALSASPSPVNVPAVIETVALARSRLSGSDTEAARDSTTEVGPSVKDILVVPESVGG